MPKPTDMFLKIPVIFSVCLFLSGCWFSGRRIPLPANDGEFTKPVRRKLNLSEPRKFKWTVVSADSVKPGPITPFDFNKLPSKAFNPESFEPLPKPASRIPFDYNALADTALNLDVIPSEPLVYKTMLLGTFKKTTLGIPKVRSESFFTSFQYGDEQGIPGSTITSTLHTGDGLLWLATDGGLCILNGESLDILPYAYGTINTMAEDKFGQVWLRTRENGVFVIDRKAGIQKMIDVPFGVHLRVDQKGQVWVCSRNGIYLISADQKTFKHITTKNGLINNLVVRTMEDVDGRIWIDTRFGVDILDPAAKKIKRIGDIPGRLKGAVFSLAQNSAGDIYLAGMQYGIDIINIRQGTRKHLDSIPGIKKLFVFNMLEDGAGRMWCATDSSGVFMLNRNIDSIAHIRAEEGLSDNTTFYLDKNEQQHMLVATQLGFNVFPPANQVAHRMGKKDGLISNDVWGLFQDDKQRIWVGTYAGVNIITPDHKILQLVGNMDESSRTEGMFQTGPDQYVMTGVGNGLILLDQSKHTREKIGLKEGLASISIFCAYRDSKGLIWVGTDNAGLTVFDPVKRTIRTLNLNTGLGNNRVDGIVEDSSGKFWISTFGGLYILDLSENTISHYSTKEGLSNDVTDMIYKDSKNRIWVATDRGINLINLAQKTNTIFSISNGMPSNGTYSLLENNGNMYAGTGKGLVVFSENTNKTSGSGETSWNLQTYGRPQGFAYLDFNGNTQLHTKNDQFWWGIVQGVSTMDASVIHTDSLSEPVEVTGIDILGKSQFFIDPSLTKDVDTLWGENKDTFYLKGSFASLNTDKEKGIEWDSLSNTSFPVNLSLPPERNYLRFHFGNVLPQYEGYYKYRYILDGVDDKWSTATDQPSSENYNNVSPGYYTFRVSAKKGDASWSEPTIYHIRIRPPWWQSWWAELIYVLIFISLLRVWVSYRSRRLLKENALLEQKVTERTTELSNSLENLRQAQGQLIQAEKMASLGELTAGIAHEIQNPLNFVNNFSEVNTELLEDVNKALADGDTPEAKEILKDVEMNMGKITFHGKRADAIVKGMLLHSRASSGQKIPTDVNALADEYLRLSYHGLRAKDKSFNAQFNMDFDETVGQAMLVQQDVGRVLLNLFNNSFYSVTEKKKQIPEGYAPTVSVSTKRKKDTIEIKVRDNGLGIPQRVIDKIYQPFFTTKPAGQGTGLGLSLSYDIVTKEHGGKIDVITKENEFTEFTIELPIRSNA
jgi:signal transduction histidine kinase/ligand-binding sensor domain-containing protein